ncbi:extracellular solute-binding protein [Gynuella sp.]|uniref:extracellular solute-binding protein n=1 Tax=Gynuella sp. TaxID=2969146 RepID=UPI003D121713
MFVYLRTCVLSTLFVRYWMVVIAVVSLLLSCDDRNSAGDTGGYTTVQLYSALPEQQIQAIVAHFEKLHPNIKIHLHQSGTEGILQRIKQDKESGSSEADVLWLADFSSAEDLKAEQLLQPYKSQSLDHIYPLFVEPEYYYTGGQVLNMVVVYNKEKVRIKPINYLSLTDPELYGCVAIVNPAVSGAAKYTLTSLMNDPGYGVNYFDELTANGLVIVQSNSQLSNMIANGDIAAGISIDTTVRSLLEDSDGLPIDYVYPIDGTIIIAAPLALLKSCHECKAAQILIDWLLSHTGQAFMSRELGTMSVRDDVPLPGGVPTLDRLHFFPSDPRQVLENSSILVENIAKRELPELAPGEKCN